MASSLVIKLNYIFIIDPNTDGGEDRPFNHLIHCKTLQISCTALNIFSII